jgi:NAD(P)-dependent dehydrogenase (short-subunit alcohol dehydrogenase family)
MGVKARGAVVVVTGASSGIGRATAFAFARKGAKLVVGARRPQPLEEVAAECRRLARDAIAVPTDVTDERAVHTLARRAVERFGSLDVWINNAGVALWSRFEDVPPDLFRRVVDTNLFGVVHGARAALPHFRAQGRGVLVNVASMLGKMAMPYYTPYVASKFAVVGFSECLRQELQSTRIDVVTIMPGAVDTPLFQHGANYLGRAVRPPRPVYAPEEVAAAIVECVEDPKRERFVGSSARAFNVLHTLAPRLYERTAAAMFELDHVMKAPVVPTPGNVLQPMAEGTATTGGWRHRGRRGRARGHGRGHGPARAARLALDVRAASRRAESRGLTGLGRTPSATRRPGDFHVAAPTAPGR